ncbi:MAG: cyclic lactone autoinducer peptide [Ruminococcus sp.]|nr:cyclic lactone autoinducer peptide [Ruminococcus sp.]
MNKVQKVMLDKLAALGQFAAVKAAGSASCAGYHQPKEPKALKNLKK